MTESSPAFGGLAWAGLAAADATVAVEFCCAAFHLEASAPGEFTVLRRAGEDVALVYPQTPQARAADVTTHWTPFFLVADVRASLERVVEAGGIALRDPFDLPQGSVGPMRDPVGAPFSLWAPRAGGPPPPSATGTWSMELATSDAATSRMFYAHVLGWTYADAAGETTILGPDKPIGRIRTTDATPDWLAFLRVPDVDEALRRAEAAGATAVRVSGGDGRTARIIDPQGATLYLQQDG
jgi:predicted enzyme related to lactoylglutathione lyase